MRKFEFARLVKDGKMTEEKAFAESRLPEYATKYASAADFCCAEDITIPVMIGQGAVNLHPVLVHTGIKACMEDDEVLIIANRSSSPIKLGLVLANSIGVIDKDYYSNPSNDGEIMFAFYNFSNEPVDLKVGMRIGQGYFQKILRADNYVVDEIAERTGGLGSTGNN